MGLADLQPRPNPLIESRYQPIGVVDIGSNSVRLVIYEGPWRHAVPIHNEKAICAIGRNMVSSGQLDESGMASALDTLARYRALCDGHNVIDVGAVATSAARDVFGLRHLPLPQARVGLYDRVATLTDTAPDA